jgi:hypothetical protein
MIQLTKLPARNGRQRLRKEDNKGGERMNAAYFSAATTDEMSNDNSIGWERQFHVFRLEMAR